MIISRTPLRISFAGGGSDIGAFYRFNKGCVVSTAINKYIYIVVNDKFDKKIRASYSVTEVVDRPDQLKHELIRECLKLLSIEGGIEIVSCSDIPSEGSGLGSSSSYTVGLLKALYAYRGKHVGAERLGREASMIEIDICGHPIGKQDQYIAAYGGLQCFTFNQDDSVHTDPVVFRPETRKQLEANLLLLYTGVTRSAKSILLEQTQRCTDDAVTKQALRSLVRLAEETREALTHNDLNSFGELLHQAWMEKRKVASGVTTESLDLFYDRGRKLGAIGGKLLGAGGGGFLLFYAPRDFHSEILRGLPELSYVPFHFEPQGSKIIFIEE